MWDRIMMAVGGLLLAASIVLSWGCASRGPGARPVSELVADYVSLAARLAAVVVELVDLVEESKMPTVCGDANDPSHVDP